MPGGLVHLAAGTAMFVIGRYYYKDYFEGVNKTKESILLLIVCLFFSILPDFFLIIYYTTHVLPFEVFLAYHDLVLLISGPIAIITLLILKYWINIKRKPLLIMGMWCILLHITMDLLIPETGIWI
jgi:uncharacterized membrane-anchored protein